MEFPEEKGLVFWPLVVAVVPQQSVLPLSSTKQVTPLSSVKHVTPLSSASCAIYVSVHVPLIDLTAHAAPPAETQRSSTECPMTLELMMPLEAEIALALRIVAD
jgi:hypothetical protein